MDHQDWKPVIFRKSQQQLKKEGKIKKEKVLNTKRPNSNNVGTNLKKLDGDEVEPPKHVPKETAKLIQQARTAKKMSQQDLANKLNVKKNIINDLESGKMLLNKGFVSRVKRVLGIK